jgi:hypothetical protein
LPHQESNSVRSRPSHAGGALEREGLLLQPFGQKGLAISMETA